MDWQCRLSNVTKNYLNAFFCILDEMIQGMTEAELTGSISHNFIVQMIPHHVAAIEMSKNILRYTTSIPLQEIAQGIIEEQTKSIQNMEHILPNCEDVTDPGQDLCIYQQKLDQIKRQMFSEMKCARVTNSPDCNFMWEMIPHHMGAVRMSQTTLRFPICQGLKPVLDAIIVSQEKGIRQMRELLKCQRCGQAS